MLASIAASRAADRLLIVTSLEDNGCLHGRRRRGDGTGSAIAAGDAAVSYYVWVVTGSLQFAYIVRRERRQSKLSTITLKGNKKST